MKIEIDSNNDEVRADLETKLENKAAKIGNIGEYIDPLYAADSADEEEKNEKNDKSKVNSEDIIEREQKKLKEIPNYKTEVYDYKLKHTKFNKF